MGLEGIKIESGFIREVKLGKFTLPVKVSVSEIEELEKHIEYLNAKMQVETDGVYEWTKQELMDFLKSSTERQKELLKFVVDKGRTNSTEIIKALNLSSSQSIAGLRAGFTARVKRDFGFKEEVLKSEWTDNGENDYFINEKYIETVKNFF